MRNTKTLETVKTINAILRDGLDVLEHYEYQLSSHSAGDDDPLAVEAREACQSIAKRLELSSSASL